MPQKYDGLVQMFGRNDVTPLWIADLDFAVCPDITAALRHRLDHPVLGYSAAPDSYWNSIINWQRKRHGFDIERDEICFIPGVVKGIGLAINYFSSKGDKIVIQPPVYHPFRMVIEGNERIVAENPLIFDGENYRMDLEGLAEIIEREKPTMMILCNPHNPHRPAVGQGNPGRSRPSVPPRRNGSGERRNPRRPHAAGSQAHTLCRIFRGLACCCRYPGRSLKDIQHPRAGKLVDGGEKTPSCARDSITGSKSTSSTPPYWCQLSVPKPPTATARNGSTKCWPTCRITSTS